MTVVLHGPPDEEGSSLLLRLWTEDDVPELIDAYRDPVMRQWTRFHVTDEQDARRWVELQRKGWNDGDRLSFAVVESRGESDRPRLVANVVLKGRVTGGNSAEVGYWTTRTARGRGIAGRALEPLTTWAFETFAPQGLECLKLLHQVDNYASCRVAQKCGYVLEEIVPARPPFLHDGHVHVRLAPQE
ncbi:acetyltransferase [Sphaerisporangium krabiense]|uniref:RimJ/RimL family protein N-acetyltransferase n=1 Tax=Sphaerisporangium krabiense TaxID=763782 RepID=A0A7W8Z0D8_9ACTN|nr:GNAT family N-acetyltransferase [Sphaerisporangium krabiense]MBB5625152.1 RimJ/RimL family protein N-acetyltransferase [Sphaerisporangium krabiense]GII64339.1 acetyltransferase [Sphaerisporangium krabiense]